MNLNRIQMQYRREGKVLLSSLNRARWSLAYHALKGKQNKVESWAEILADLARIEERTAREWAQAAEFREEVRRVHGKYIDLSYSFYARASRKIDMIEFDTIIGLMVYFESNPDSKISTFDVKLSELAGPELPDFGGYPPSGYPPADAIKDECARLKELVERPDMPAPVATFLTAARTAIDSALAWFGEQVNEHA